MNSKFTFLRSVANDSAKIAHLRKMNVDVLHLIRQYGGVTNKVVDENSVNADYSIILDKIVAYNQNLVKPKQTKISNN